VSAAGGVRRTLFAPGAGAPSSSDWMVAWAQRLAAIAPVQTLDYPYQRAGRRSPDRLPTLIDAHREALDALSEPAAEVVLAGKSMGSRVGCHLALERPVRALVCLGYPLVGAGRARPLRDQVLLALRTPILFVQGDRDPLCPLDRLDEVRGRMSAVHALHVVEGGNHSLVVGKRTLARRGETQGDVDRRVGEAIARFLSGASGAWGPGGPGPPRCPRRGARPATRSLEGR